MDRFCFMEPKKKQKNEDDKADWEQAVARKRIATQKEIQDWGPARNE